MTDIETETQRVMRQAAKLMAKPFISAVTEDEQWERRQQYLCENPPEREKSEYDEHHTSWGPL